MLTPKGTVSGNKVEFRWTGSKAETQYLWRALEGGKTVKAAMRSASSVGCRQGGVCRFVTSLNQGQYQWQIRPFVGEKRQSWSNKLSFAVGRGSIGSDAADSGSGGSSGTSNDGGFVAATANVRNQTEFTRAVKGGQKTIIVADGTYQFPKITQSGMTIKAASYGKAKITNRAMIENAQDVTIEGFQFVSTNSFDAIFCAKKCHNAIIRKNIIRAKNADYGIRVHRSNNVKILDNVFEGAFNHAVSAKDKVFGMDIRGNRFTDCGRLCVEASQTVDGTMSKDDTSDNIRVESNEFIGKSLGAKPSFNGLGIRLGNAVNVYVRNNKFTGNWRLPVFSDFGSVGADNNSRLGVFGSKHPTRAHIEGNVFNGGTIALNGRGRVDDTMFVSGNKGNASCKAGNLSTRGGRIDRLVDWSTVYRGRPRVQSSNNSFGSCS
ncbi:MAG: right-handed parallel beta-helix repeat-containing protein [Pseudomonadota bacterium]